MTPYRSISVSVVNILPKIVEVVHLRCDFFVLAVSGVFIDYFLAPASFYQYKSWQDITAQDRQVSRDA